GDVAGERRRVRQTREAIRRRMPRERARLPREVVEGVAREVGGRHDRARLADEDAESRPALPRARQLLDVAEADADREAVALDDDRVGGAGARRGSPGDEAARDLAEVGGVAHACVPPTVRPSMRTVGRPTPTGTDCPSLPQVPMTSSSWRSAPTREMRVSTSGPLPMSVAPRTGRPILPPSIR